MLITASQFGPRARSLRTNHAAASATATATVYRMLGASGALTLQQCQQTRDFRFGSWFTHLDSEIQDKIRQRHEQTFKQRYIGRFRHNLDDHPLANDARHAVKRMMASYWLSHDPRPCVGREDSGSSKQRTPHNRDGVRPGQNIEDVERGAMEHLIFGKDEEEPARGLKSKRKRGGKKKKQFHLFSGFPKEQDDYFIDPVTNRKVARPLAPTNPDGGADISVKTFKDYRTRYSTRHAAPGVYDEIPLNEPHKASQVEADPNAEYPGGPSRLSGKSAGDGVRHSDMKPEFDDLHKYRPVLDEGQISSEAPQQPHAAMDKCEPVKNKESAQFQDLNPPYQDLDKYNEAVVDEIVDRFESDNGLYSDLHGYSQDVSSESAFDRDAAPGYSGLDELGPALSANSAAKRTEAPPPEEDLDSYVPPEVDEPHEKPQGPQIPIIGPSWMSGNHQPLVENLEPGDFHPSTIEQLREKYGSAGLRKYTVVGNAEPKRNSSSPAAERVAEAPTGKSQPEELENYKPVNQDEPDPNPLPSADERVVEDLTKRYDPEELAKYTPAYWDEPNSQHSAAAEGWSKRYTDLDPYRPAKWKNSAREGLENLDVKRDFECPDPLAPEELDRADESSAEALRRLCKSQQLEQNFEDISRRLVLESQMKKYQAASDATDHEASLAVKSARARAADTESQRHLTGNYVRDFPEEFEKSWTETLSTAPTETAQPDYGFVFESQNMDGGLEGAFGRPSPAKIQPALDRHFDVQQPEATSGIGSESSGKNSTQEAMDANTSSGTAASPAHLKPHNDILTPANKGMEPQTSDTIHHETANEPTLYKILAYDPTMQKIEIAETSSFVPDTASALTPADALLRLSHPTRFFPHFGPLQAQGYEIISGTGDVLVFRKVRSEVRTGIPAEQTPVPEQSVPAAEESAAIETRINPIDMTGMPRFSPASANFASPTGYVNYEHIPETAASKLPPPPPRIKYNIDVHREEPVFSGPKARINDKRSKKTGLGKRLIVGGVWVAGISYALGVISEYFTTGGMDGLGPRGL